MRNNLLAFILICFSCGVMKNDRFIGNEFIFENKERTLTICFKNRDVLSIENLFDCDIDSILKK